MCSLTDSMAASNGCSAVWQFRTQALGLFRIHVAHIAPAQSFAIALGQSASRVDQRRPRPHQSSPRPDHHQVRLRPHAAVLHRIQQLRIDPGQPRQRLRIQPIVFLAALPDQTHLARIRHDHFMPQLAEQATDPRANASRFPVRSDCAAWRRRLRATLSAFVRTRCSSRIWPASSTTQYQLLRSPRSNPMVSLCCEIFLLCAAALVLIFFIAGLLFICASSTSITWERTASRRRPAFSLENSCGGGGLSSCKRL